ncbi:hypothetical protein DFH29DRAFT_1070187 [Suillus ampliporus]|nr:hypothetical protein DFH29DRAFT_1070187 [Suillus ampliporus]
MSLERLERASVGLSGVHTNRINKLTAPTYKRKRTLVPFYLIHSCKMSTSASLPPFDSSAARIGMLRLSNILVGPAEWLNFYIKLIPTEMLRTELYLLYTLLKGRVYAGDLWQMVGWRMVEVQNEELLRSTGGDGRTRVIAERTFMEEKWARCQMEVSMYSQAIEHIEQRKFSPRKILLLSQRTSGLMPCYLARCPVAVPVTHKHNIRSFSTTSRHVAPVTCSVAVQEKCKAWLMGQDTDLVPADEISLIENDSSPNDSTPQEKRTNVIVNSIGPSFPLLSTWITTDTQESFDRTREVELTSLAELMPKYLDIETHQRDVQLELLILQTMRCRAQIELIVYTIAMENAPAFDDSDSDKFIPSPLSEEMRYDDDDIDCDDFCPSFFTLSECYLVSIQHAYYLSVLFSKWLILDVLSYSPVTEYMRKDLKSVECVGLSSDLYPHWNKSHGLQPEIQAYWIKLSKKYNLYPHIAFNTIVLSAEWDNAKRQYTLVAEDVFSGKRTTSVAHVMISAVGFRTRSLAFGVSGGFVSPRTVARVNRSAEQVVTYNKSTIRAIYIRRPVISEDLSVEFNFRSLLPTSDKTLKKRHEHQPASEPSQTAVSWIAGIAEIVESGIITNTGEMFPFDIIIYATGFIGVPVAKKERGPTAYLGTAIPDLPELTCYVYRNTNIVIVCGKPVLSGSASSITVKALPTDAYNAKVQERISRSVFVVSLGLRWFGGGGFAD